MEILCQGINVIVKRGENGMGFLSLQQLPNQSMCTRESCGLRKVAYIYKVHWPGFLIAFICDLVLIK